MEQHRTMRDLHHWAGHSSGPKAARAAMHGRCSGEARQGIAVLDSFPQDQVRKVTCRYSQFPPLRQPRCLRSIFTRTITGGASNLDPGNDASGSTAAQVPVAAAQNLFGTVLKALEAGCRAATGNHAGRRRQLNRAGPFVDRGGWGHCRGWIHRGEIHRPGASVCRCFVAELFEQLVAAAADGYRAGEIHRPERQRESVGRCGQHGTETVRRRAAPIHALARH